MHMTAEQPLGEREVAILRWRSRRGLVENDLFIERFFDRHGAQITPSQADAITTLMNLADNDLLDLLLRRSEPAGELDTDTVRTVLELLRERT